MKWTSCSSLPLAIITLLLQLLPAPAFSNAIPLTDSDSRVYLLSHHAEYWAEPAEPASLASVRTLSDDSFKPIADLKSLEPQSPHWLRFRFDDGVSLKDHEFWYILSLQALYARLEVYEPDGYGGFRHLLADGSAPIHQRQVESQQLVLPLQPAQAGGHYYYARIIPAAMASPLMLGVADRATVQALRDHSTLLSAAVYGAFAALLIFSLLFLLGARTQLFLFYSTLNFCSMVLVASMDGTGFRLIWPDHPSVHQWLPHVVGLLLVLNQLLLAGAVMQTRKGNRRAHQLLMSTVGVLAVTMASAYFLELQRYIVVAAIVGVVGTTMLVVVVLEGIRRRVPAAPIFLLACLSPVFGALLRGPLFQRFDEVGVWAYFSLPIALLLQLILFAVCIAAQLRQLQIQRSDLTREKLEAQDMALKAYRDSLALKNEFLATVSHELRTPMNGIVCALELLGDDLPANQRTVLDAARRSSDELMRQVDDILSFTELQSATVTLQETEFSLRLRLDALEKRFRNVCSNRGLLLHWHVDPTIPPRLCGDIGKLLKVLNKLLDNACRFTEDGEIRFTAMRQSRFPEPRDNTPVIVSFVVTDSGPGINDRDVEKAFTSFQQLDGSFQRRHSGLGIGLAMSRQLVELMGGELRVNPANTGGSEFHFSLPLAPARSGSEQDEREDADTAQAFSLPEATVLVVEDTPTNQVVMRGMLTKAGFKVLIAGNGRQALDVMASGQRVDLILMDCQMPEMDGFEATRAIRSGNEAYRGIPIIAVTANAMAGDRDRCLAAGMDDYISKPIKRQLLLEKINKWLAADASPVGTAR